MTLLQDAIVTLVALWAAWIVARRVLGFVRPAPAARPACANCPSAAAKPTAADPALGTEERPLVFIKAPRH
jgi:hypothetical protein